MKITFPLSLIMIFISSCLRKVPDPQDFVGIYYSDYPTYSEFIEFKSDSTYFHFVIDDKKDTIAQYTDRWVILSGSTSIDLCGFRQYNNLTKKISRESKWKYGVQYEDRIGSPPEIVGLSTHFEKVPSK